MSISGKEESGSFNWQLSNYSSGIPIKKRKFALFRPPSPELQESPDISSVEAKISSPSLELSSLNVEDGASNANKSPVSNINEAITADAHVNLDGLNNQLSSVSQAPILPITLDSLDRKEEPSICGQQNMTGDSKLDSAEVEVSVETAMKNLPGLLQAGKDCTPELFRNPGNSELSLGPEEPLVSVSITDLDSKGGNQIPDKFDPSTLCLSLSHSANGYEVEDSMVKSAGTHVYAKRSNWDLNTPMDAWEGPSGDCDSLVTVMNPFSMRHVEPMISAVPENSFLDTREQFFGVTRKISDSPTSSHVDKYRSDDSLQLSLSTSAPTVFSVKQSNVSAQVNSGEGLVSTRRTSSAVCDTVKSEPFDENGKDGNSGVRGIPIKLLDQENSGLVEKSITKAVTSPNASLKNVSEPLSVKSEPVQEGKEKQIIPHTSFKKVIMCQENVSLSLRTAEQPNESLPLGLFTCSKLAVSEDVPNQSDNTARMEEKACEGKDKTQVSCTLVNQAAAGMLFPSPGHDSKESYTSDGLIYTGSTGDANVDKPEKSRLESEDVFTTTQKNSDVFESDKEKQIIPHTSFEKVMCQENVSLSLRTAGQPKESLPLGLFTCSKLAVSEDVPNQSYNTARMEEEAREGKDKTQVSCTLVNQAATRMLFPSLGHDSKESNTSDGMIYTGSTGDANVDKPEKSRLESDDVFTTTQKNSDVFESDKENKNILTDILEEDAYRSDSGSEGNHESTVNSKTKHDGKEDEYEDGEVREALMHVEADVAMDDMEKEMINQDAFDCTNSPAPDINDSKVQDHGEISDNPMEDTADVVLQKAIDEATDRDCSLQESSTVEETADKNDEKRPNKTTGRSPPVISGGTDNQEGHDMEELSDGATVRSRDNGITVSQIASVGIEGTDTFERVDPTLPNTESYLSDKNSGKATSTAEADKDGNSGGSRSRIINLSRATNGTSTCEPKLMFTRPLSATERDRHTDFEEDRVPLQRNRSEFYANVPQNFDDDRFHDRSFRNSGTNFVRGRGRGRGFRQHVEWDSDRNFGADMNYNSGSYRFSKYKCAGGDDAEFEGNGYGIATSRSSGIGRGRNSYHRPYSRRLSPGATYGTGTRGTHVLRRFSGNANSSRSIGEHNPDFVGPRNGGKYTRGLPKDVHDPTYDHSRHVNEGVDDQFVGGSRNFSTSVQRRGPRRIRSKSPVTSRTRSPGQWPSPRRRSSDNLIELQELNHRRSPTTYRMDRTRSPDHPCFPEESMGRRGGSPPYVTLPSHDVRNTESGSANPNRRRPYDKVVPESTRRINITDPRERRDGEFFRGPNYSGRYNEFGGEGRGDERRKYGERRGRGRSFRPSFSGADGDNLRFHENGNRSFCPETDSKHIERGDLREREFDRRINYKTGIASGRTRNLEEGVNRRGQVWHDDGFDDVPEMKRRKF